MPTSHNKEFQQKLMRLDYERLRVIVYDENDAPKDITNDRLVFEARLVKTAQSPVIVKTTDVPTEIEKVDPANGIARIYLDRDDTSQFTKGLTLYCTLTDTDALGRSSSILFSIPVEFRY